MHLRRRSIISLITVGVALTALCGAIDTGTAGAAQRIGMGTFNCGNVTGRMTFNPPLKPNGMMPETVTIGLTATTCDGGRPTPERVHASLELTFPRNTCRSREMGGVGGTLGFVPRVMRSQWYGFAYLEPDSSGDPTMTNVEPSEIAPSYYSDYFAGSGAQWQFFTQESPNRCSKAEITTATLSYGVFGDF